MILLQHFLNFYLIGLGFKEIIWGEVYSREKGKKE